MIILFFTSSCKKFKEKWVISVLELKQTGLINFCYILDGLPHIKTRPQTIFFYRERFLMNVLG